MENGKLKMENDMTSVFRYLATPKTRNSRTTQFSILHYPFSILRFPFSVFHFPFSIIHSPSSALRPPLPVSRCLLLAAFCFLLAISAEAQHRKLTVILLRHAEKDVSATADRVNPVLAPEGRLRAEKLVKAVRKYKIDAIYSSDFVRTRDTVAPLALRRGLAVEIYDHRDLKRMAEMIASGKIKRILVVGHNSTTPALVNLLLGTEKYRPLAETEYDKLFVVKIRKYKRKPARVEERVLTY